MSTLINIGVGLLLLVLLYACRSKLFGFLAPYFGGGGGSEMTPAKDIKFKKVGRKPDDDAASTTSCGLSGGEEEVDPIAEEWAARLAAQREGRPYVPKEQPTTKLAITGCGAGAVPNFGAAGGGAAATIFSGVGAMNFVTALL